jgi:hypothetical protein
MKKRRAAGQDTGFRGSAYPIRVSGIIRASFFGVNAFAPIRQECLFSSLMPVQCRFNASSHSHHTICGIATGFVAE